MFGQRNKRLRNPSTRDTSTQEIHTSLTTEPNNPALSFSTPAYSPPLPRRNVTAAIQSSISKTAPKKHPLLPVRQAKTGEQNPRKASQKPPSTPLHSLGDPPGLGYRRAKQHSSQGALCDLISSKLDSVLTSIDGETFHGDDEELLIHEGPQVSLRGGWGSGPKGQELSRGANRAISTAIVSTNYFSKANLYANSKLPPALPPLQLYLPSFPLLCLAAQYSLRAYDKPSGKEREAFVNADWRMGTKAMVIKSVPVDDMNCVVFAIRGSQTFMDWAVNLNSAPVSPSDFLVGRRYPTKYRSHSDN